MRKSVIDYMLFGKAIEVVKMVVVDSGKFDVGLDHNRRGSGINGEWMVSWTRRNIRM